MTVAKQKMTVEEYLSYDDGTDNRYELVDGELVLVGAESKLNAQIAMFLVACFLDIGIPHYLLSTKVELVVSSRKATTRSPDLVVLTDVLEALLDNAYRYIVESDMPAPQLVVEVVSPGVPGEQNYDRDYVEKRQEYAERGISEYWLIDPQRQVVWVLTLQAGAYHQQSFTGQTAISSPTFPNLSLTASQVLGAGRP
ncbi:MAG: Uma2 family endonuclease [Thermosynechococcaceae cyanobacterium]